MQQRELKDLFLNVTTGVADIFKRSNLSDSQGINDAVEALTGRIPWDGKLFPLMVQIARMLGNETYLQNSVRPGADERYDTEAQISYMNLQEQSIFDQLLSIDDKNAIFRREAVIFFGAICSQVAFLASVAIQAWPKISEVDLMDPYYRAVWDELKEASKFCRQSIQFIDSGLDLITLRQVCICLENIAVSLAWIPEEAEFTVERKNA